MAHNPAFSQTTGTFYKDSNGNFGIGTTGPVSKLQINGGLTASSTVGIGTTLAPSTTGLSVMNGNVGIGTWSPTAKLHIAGGNILLENNRAISVAESGGFVHSVLSMNSGGQLVIGAAPVIRFNTGSGGFFTFESPANTERIRITDTGNLGMGTGAPVGALVVMNGNVGIGTWSPTQALEVVGRVRSTTGGFQLPDGTVIDDATDLTGGTGPWTDGGTNVYVTTTTDNVGIGTTTPSTTLEIIKSGSNAPLMISSVPTGDGDYFVVKSEGNVGIGTINPELFLTIRKSVNSDVGMLSINTNAGISAYANNGFQNDAGVQSWVGIGGAATAVAYASRGFLVGSGANGTSIVASNASGDVRIYTGGTGVANERLRVGSDGTIGIGTGLATSGLAVMNGNVGIGTWDTSGASGVLVTTAATGNVGLGTIRPGARLDVNGRVRSTTGGFQLPDGTVIDDATDLTGGTGPWTDGGTNVYTTTTTDNVGIGTTTPNAATLEVVKNAAQAPLKISSTATAAGDFFVLDSSGTIGVGTTLNTSSTGLSIMNGNVGIGTWSSGGKLIVLGGNVGIGTSTPQYKLHVAGPNPQIALEETGTSSANINFRRQNTTKWYLLLNHPGTGKAGTDNIAFYDASTSRPAFMINPGGNIGIGTETPVEGTAIMNGNLGIGTWSMSGVSGALIVAPGVGNVGIGTIRPGVALDVNGRVRSTTGGFQLPDGTVIDDASDLGGAASVGWTDGGTNVYTSTTTDNVGIGTTTPSATLEVVKTVAGTAPFMVSTTATADGDLLIVNSAGSVSVGENSPHTYETFTISRDFTESSANLPAQFMMNGIVTLNTFTSDIYHFWLKPKSTVDTIHASTVYTAAIYEPNITLQNGGLVDRAAALYVRDAPTEAAENYALLVNSGLSMFDGPVGLGTYKVSTGLSVMSGNVGIGTWSSPANSLSIADGNIGIGTYLAYRRISAPNNGMVMEGNLGVGTWNPSTKLQVAGTVTAAAFVGDGSGLTNVGASGWTDGGTNLYTSTTTDNVGIGTTTPASATTLEIVKNGASQAPLRISSAATGNGDILNINSTGRIGIGTTLLTSSTAMSIMTGNLGIGTWNPEATLAITSGASTPLRILGVGGNTNLRLSAPAGSASLLELVGDDAGGSGWAITRVGATHDLEFRNGGNPTAQLYLMKATSSVGFGTSKPVGGMAIMSGNVGIGTWSMSGESGALIIADAAGNVGVGTIRPGAKVDVNGRVRSATGGFQLPDGTIIDDASDLGGAASVGWSDGGTNVYVTTTTDNVGIGTTTPNTATLEIVKNAAQAPFKVSSSALGAGDFLNVSSVGSVGIGTTLNASGTALSVMSGNIGIGTWNSAALQSIFLPSSGTGPHDLLLLAGTKVAADPYNLGLDTSATTPRTFLLSSEQNALRQALAFSDASNLNQPIFGISASSDSGTTWSPHFVIQQGGNIGIGTRTSAGALSIMNGSVGIGTWSMSGVSGSLIISDGAGNVGIGTIRPGAKLDIRGPSSSEPVFRVTGASGGSYMSVAGTGILTFGTFASGSGVNMIDFGNNVTAANNDSTYFLVNPNSVDATSYVFRVRESTANRFVIDGNGNVGIGTWKPEALLATSSGNIGFGTIYPVGTAIMNGNVGIGTWSARAGLEIGGAGTINNAGQVDSVYIKNNLEVDGSIYLADGTQLNDASDLGGAASVGWTDGGTNVYTSTTTDNVGIGTTTPTSTLEVVKTAAGTAPLMISSAATADGNVMIVTSGGNVGIGTTADAAGLAVMTGNVGIGTWSPVGALQVLINTGGGGAGLSVRQSGGSADIFSILDNQRLVYSNSGSTGGVNQINFTGASFPSNGSYFLINPSYSISGLRPLFHVMNGARSYFDVTENGNIGISTINPMSRLVINGGVGIGTLSSSTFLNITAPDGGLIVEKSVGIGTTLASPATGLTVMNGNVGIGTWNAQAALDVKGSIRTPLSSGSIPYVGSTGLISEANTELKWADSILYLGDQSAVPVNWYSMNGLSVGAGTVYLENTSIQGFGHSGAVGAATASNIGDSLLNLWFAGADSNGDPRDAANIRGIVDEAVGANYVPGALEFRTTDSGGATRSRLFLTSQGSVGIGTISPVNGTSIMNGNVGIGTWSMSGVSGALIVASGAGNVGIGTIRPGAALDVNGTVRATAFVGDGSGLTGISGGSSGWTDGGTNVYTSTTTDNVGIGTTTPNAATLEVVKNAGQPLLKLSSVATGSGDMMTVTSVGSVGIGTALPPPTTKLTVFGGNVGIGTWNAQFPLDVATNIGIGTTTVIYSGATRFLYTTGGSGGFNTFVGNGSGTLGASGKSNTALGHNSMAALTSGGSNTALGFAALSTNQDGANNTAVGMQALYNTLSSGLNSALGVNAGLTNSTGSNNTYLGALSNSSAALTNATAVGYNTQVAASNALILGTSANVGIGTQSPQATLAVVKNGTSVFMLSSASTSNGDYMLVGSDGRVGIGTTLMPSTIGLTVMNGNVGIGTWSPRAGLEIGGAGTINNAGQVDSVYIKNNLEVDGSIYLADGTQLNDASDLGGAASVGWSDGGTNVYVTTTTDNVGIGTTTPSSTVEIVKTAAGTAPFMVSSAATADGNVFVIKSDGNVGISTINPEGRLVLRDSGALPTDGYALIVHTDDSNPFMAGFFNDTFSANTASFEYYASDNGDFRMGTHGGNNLDFYTNGYNNRRLSISSTGNVGIGTNANVAGLAVMNGYVGIGTWSPLLPLEIKGVAGDAGVGLNAGGPGGVHWLLNSTDNANLTGGGKFVLSRSTDSTLQAKFAVDGSGNAGIGTSMLQAGLSVMSGGVGIGTWNTSGISGALIVSGGAGNVGIGTIRPGAVLDVNGRVRSTTGGFQLPDGTIVDDASDLGGAASVGWTDGGTNVYTSTTTDNVGIGTTTPVNRLSIQGGVGIGTTAAIVNIAAPNNGLVVEGNVGIGTWAPDAQVEVVKLGSQAPLMISSAGTGNGDYLIVNSSGNVGIGSRSPSNALEITSATSGFPNMLLRNTGQTSATFSAGIGVVNGTYNEATFSANLYTSGGTYNLYDTSSYGVSFYMLPRWTAGNEYIGMVYYPPQANPLATAYYPFVADMVNGTIHLGATTSGHTQAYSGQTVTITNQTASDQLLTLRPAASQTGNLLQWQTSGGVNMGALNASGGLGIGTSLMTTNTGLAVMNGNVGIGTWSSPGDSLYIADGNIGIGTYLAYRRIGGPNNGMVMEGNLGVGTWNPSTKVQVVGTVTATAFVGDGSGLTGISGGNAGWTDGGTNVYTSTTTDNVGIGTTTPASGTTLEIVKNGASQFPLRISSAATGKGDVFVIDSFGNVGINTINPEERFVVNSQSVNSMPAMYLRDASGNLGVIGRGSNIFSTARSTDIAISAPANMKLFMGVDNVVGETIDSSGRVGMGTISPIDTLSVVGNIGIGTYTAYRRIAGPNNGMVMEGNLGVGTWNPTTKVQVVGTVTATAFVGDGSGLTGISGGNAGWTDGGANVYTSTTTDNVGIGTTTPNATTLEIVKNAAQPLLKLSSVATGNGDYLLINSAGTVGIGTSLAPSPVKFAVMGGNVGLGTWNPREALEIKNTVVLSSEYDNGSKGGAFTITWDNGNKQKVTLTGSTTHAATFTNPTGGVGNFTLRIVQGDASNTISSWTTAKWPGGTAPTLSSAANAEDIVSCYYNGSSMYCTSSLNFQ